METTLLDHAFVAILAVVFPVHGVWEYRRLQAHIKAGRPLARVRSYLQTIVIEWVAVLALLAAWIYIDRSLPALGLGLSGSPGLWIGIGLTIAGVGLLVIQNRTLMNDDDRLARYGAQFDTLRPMLPHDDRETRWFAGLSVTAGICEELLYRGFLIAYFASWLGVWPAVILSSLIFGLGHSYQGAGGFLKTSVVGLVFAGLFVLTGSLWAPIVLHIVLDLASGQLARHVVERFPASPAPSSS